VSFTGVASDVAVVVVDDVVGADALDELAVLDGAAAWSDPHAAVNRRTAIPAARRAPPGLAIAPAP